MFLKQTFLVGGAVAAALAAAPRAAAQHAPSLERTGQITRTAAGGPRILDVAVSPRGSIHVLFSGGVVREYARGRMVREISGRGVPVGTTFVDGPGIAVGPGERLYAFDRGLNAIAAFDRGRFVSRELVPTRFGPFYSFVVDAEGRFVFGAFTPDAPAAQVHALCRQVDCPLRSLGEARATRDPDAAPFFRSGFVAPGRTGVLFAGLNPLTVSRFDPARGTEVRIFSWREMEDGEALGYQEAADGRRTISNQFPQATGLAELASGDIVVSTFFPGRATSVFLLLDAQGRLRSRAEVPGYLRVEGVLPGGELVVLHNGREQEVTTYRLSAGR